MACFSPAQVKATSITTVDVAEKSCAFAEGSENTSPLCTDGVVTNIFKGNVSNHDGPYNGIVMGC